MSGERKNGTPQPPGPAKLLELFKPASALSRLSPKSRAQIEAASRENLQELVAVEVVRRVEAEQAAAQMHADVEAARGAIHQGAVIAARIMAHYSRATMLAPDKRYASLEVVMPFDERQLAVPDDFEIVAHQQPDQNNPAATVLVVRMVRHGSRAGAGVASALVDADGKPVGGDGG